MRRPGEENFRERRLRKRRRFPHHALVDGVTSEQCASGPSGLTSVTEGCGSIGDSANREPAVAGGENLGNLPVRIGQGGTDGMHAIDPLRQ